MLIRLPIPFLTLALITNDKTNIGIGAKAKTHTPHADDEITRGIILIEDDSSNSNRNTEKPMDAEPRHCAARGKSRALPPDSKAKNEHAYIYIYVNIYIYIYMYMYMYMHVYMYMYMYMYMFMYMYMYV